MPFVVVTIRGHTSYLVVSLSLVKLAHKVIQDCERVKGQVTGRQSDCRALFRRSKYLCDRRPNGNHRKRKELSCSQF